MGALTSRQEWPPINRGFQKRWEKRLVIKNEGKMIPQLVKVNNFSNVEMDSIYEAPESKAAVGPN